MRSCVFWNFIAWKKLWVCFGTINWVFETGSSAQRARYENEQHDMMVSHDNKELLNDECFYYIWLFYSKKTSFFGKSWQQTRPPGSVIAKIQSLKYICFKRLKEYFLYEHAKPIVWYCR